MQTSISDCQDVIYDEYKCYQYAPPHPPLEQPSGCCYCLTVYALRINTAMSSFIYEHVIKACDDLTVIVKNSLLKQGVLKRAMSDKQIDQLNVSVRVLVLESLLAHAVQPFSSVSIAKRVNFYNDDNPESVGLSFRMHVEKVYPTLCLLGYLRRHKKGYYDRALKRGKRELFTLTDKLIEFCLPRDLPRDELAKQLSWSHELLVQNDTIPQRHPVQISQKDPKTKERRVVSVIRNANTFEMFERLKTINNRLEKTWIDLDLSDSQWKTIRNGWIDSRGDHQSLKLHKRRLYRIFHDEQLRTGGRFYGGWWQEIPSQFRRSIVMDGKATVECDFSNMNPSLLYARVGLPCPPDAYAPIAGDQHRKLFKKAFNAMLNAPPEMDQPPRDLNLSSLNMSWREVVERVKTFHEPIAHFFFKSAGMWLMREDSELAESVMLKFDEMGYACLPVHDSFILHHGLEEDLLHTMTSVFCRRYGIEPAIKIRRRIAQAADDNHDLLPLNVDEILEKLDTPQDHRLEAFRALGLRSTSVVR